MNSKYLILVSLGVAILFSSGCAGQSQLWGPTRLETDYGTSFQLQKFNQTLNPDAEKNMAPVVGLNGQAAQAVVDKYQKSFEQETQAIQNYQFSVGDISSGQ